MDPCDIADFTVQVSLDIKEHSVYVRQRPFLQAFLEKVAEIFEVIVFTTSESINAEQLLNIIDPNRRYEKETLFKRCLEKKLICAFGEWSYLCTVLQVEFEVFFTNLDPMPALKVKSKSNTCATEVSCLCVARKTIKISRTSASLVQLFHKTAELVPSQNCKNGYGKVEEDGSNEVIQKIYNDGIYRSRQKGFSWAEDPISLKRKDFPPFTGSVNSEAIFCPLTDGCGINLKSSAQDHEVLVPKENSKGKHVTLVLDLDDFTFEISFDMKEHTVFVRQRPFLRTFLEKVAEMFEVVVFTASESIYAEQLLNIIDPNRRYIARRLFRDSCIFSNGSYIKDLTVVGVDLSKIVIIDNSPQVFRRQVNTVFQ